MIYEMLTETPQSTREIASILHCDPRRVAEQIQLERRSGYPILANELGFFVSVELESLSAYIKRLERQFKEIKKTLKAMKKLEKVWREGGLPLI